MPLRTSLTVLCLSLRPGVPGGLHGRLGTHGTARPASGVQPMLGLRDSPQGPTACSPGHKAYHGADSSPALHVRAAARSAPQRRPVRRQARGARSDLYEGVRGEPEAGRDREEIGRDDGCSGAESPPAAPPDGLVLRGLLGARPWPDARASRQEGPRPAAHARHSDCQRTPHTEIPVQLTRCGPDTTSPRTG